jgi:hypothetical protein
MAKDKYQISDLKFISLGGMDESVSETDQTDSQVGALVFKPLNVARGMFPYFQGMHQRMTGKKIIDYNPAQSVMGIVQTFNGVCQYGYYVQTTSKLYYHLCAAPPDMRIHWFF